MQALRTSMQLCSRSISEAMQGWSPRSTSELMYLSVSIPSLHSEGATYDVQNFSASCEGGSEGGAKNLVGCRKRYLLCSGPHNRRGYQRARRGPWTRLCGGGTIRDWLPVQRTAFLLVQKPRSSLAGYSSLVLKPLSNLRVC